MFNLLQSVQTIGKGSFDTNKSCVAAETLLDMRRNLKFYFLVGFTSDGYNANKGS